MCVCVCVCVCARARACGGPAASPCARSLAALQDELPYNDYFEYYGPDYRLHITPSNMENLNKTEYLEDIKVGRRRRVCVCVCVCACACHV